jgi:hypothetical protein
MFQLQNKNTIKPIFAQFDSNMLANLINFRRLEFADLMINSNKIYLPFTEVVTLFTSVVGI